MVAAADPVIFGVWTSAALRAEDASAALASAVAHARGLRQAGIVVAMHPDMALPDTAVRDIIQLEMRKMDPYLAVGVTILTRDGLRGTAMRAVISTVQLLSRPTHPEKIVASPRDGILFLQKTLALKVDKAPSVEEILTVYDEVTRRAWNKV